MKSLKFRERPRIKPSLSPADKITESIIILLLLSYCAFALIVYYKLPEEIPTHYNASGNADRFGDRTSFLILPGVAAIIYLGLTSIGRYPHTFNYLIKITAENALKQYTLAVRLLRQLKLVCIIVFAIISYKTYLTAVSNGNGLGQWFLPLSFALFFIPLITYMIRSAASK